MAQGFRSISSLHLYGHAIIRKRFKFINVAIVLYVFFELIFFHGE